MVDGTAGMFNALSHPLRLRIVDRLITAGTATPNELADHFGESQQNVSKHLKTLAHAGLVNRRKDGSSALYSIRDDAIADIVADAEGVVRRVLVELSASAGLANDVERGASTG